MSTKHLIKNIINPNDLWKGIGGHFDSLSQILHELIDNSISNFKANINLNHHTVLIHIDSKSVHKFVTIHVEDTGTGIKNIDSAFTIGNKEGQETPLNEHGFGLKHALATANPNNDNWIVYTRNVRSIRENNVIVVKSPYMLEGYESETVAYNNDNYPSKLSNIETGTIVKFQTSSEMYETLGKFGTKDPIAIAQYLKENLGFTYAGIIANGIVEIQIVIDDNDKLFVNAVEPSWKTTVMPGKNNQKVDLGLLANSDSTGEVIIKYEFGTIYNREADDNEKFLYYKTNTKSSGVEIRLNGRMIKNNLLHDIWPDFDQHNRFNSFLVLIDLISDSSSSLPATRSSKNGFKQGDIKLAGLYNWIRTHCPVPYEDKYEREQVHLFEDLKIQKIRHLSSVVEHPLTVLTNRRVLKISKELIKIDLFIAYENKIIIYKGKTGTSNALDLYNLRLYWDACVVDKLQPTSAILIASDHSDTVQDLVAMNNSLKDINGNNYKFLLKRWTDEGIDYPKKEL